MGTEQDPVAAQQEQRREQEAALDRNAAAADDSQRKMVEEARNAGVTAFTFDPDASPEEKRAKARDAIPKNLQRSHGFSIVTDADDSGAPVADLPSPTTAGVIEPPKDKDGKTITDGEDPISNVDMWEKTGWGPRFGWPYEPINASESLLDHSTWLEGNIPDKFFGDWYHNAAIIVFACLSSWLVAVLGGGLGWVFIVMAFCATYYRTSVRRVRRNFRDDISREMALKRLDTDTESLEWINSFLVKFWPIYQPVLSQTIINSVDQVLSSATPAFLDSLKLKTFTLGSKPPRMEHVKTYPKAEDDVVIMDWKFSFTPNDTDDMTSRQIKNKINPKIVLEIRIGKAMISKGLDVIVQDMAFSGIMRLKVKLQIPFPHVEKVEMCFLERPMIDYVCKPLGGEMFGFDINIIPGLESFIQEQIHGNLAPMMYAPNVFPIEVAKMLSGTPVDQAIGVVAITLHGAEGLKNTDNFAGVVDPYAVVTLNRRGELARTKMLKDTANPRWNETHYIIITTFHDSLDVQVFDYNDMRKDKELGVASFALEKLEEETEHENQRIEVLSDGKVRGVLSCDVRFFPILGGQKNEDGTEEPPPESNQGILRFTVEQAKDLDGTKSLVGLLNPYAVLHLNGHDIHTSKKLKRTNNPIWDNGFKEMLITDRKHAKLGVTIKDERDLAGDQTLGKYQIKADDLVRYTEEGKDWFQLAGAQSGRVKLKAQWKPVVISGVMAGTGGYSTPIGVMRFHLIKANDLRNFEALGKSDAYGRVLQSGIEKARTVTFLNNLDPEFNEVLYVPVHSSRERLTLEVMDAEKVGKDRSLGLIEIQTNKYIRQNEEGEYLVHDEKEERSDGLRLHGKGMAKGRLTYNVSFYPCLNVADPEEEEEEQKEKAEEAAEAEKSDSTAKSSSSTSESQEEASTPRSPVSPASPTSDKPTTDKPTSSKEERSEPKKVYLTPDELLKHESGLLIFRLMDAEFAKSNCKLEVYTDDMAFPSYVSSVAQTKNHKFEEVGDCVIREIDVSRLTLVVRENRGDKTGAENEDNIVAKLAGNTLDTLKQCLNNPTILKMKDEEGRTSSVKVSLKYVPIMMNLDPIESINNMGTLRVDVLDAQDLQAADRNGKSDPFCKFEFNGQEVHKTKTQKKTLNPVWNEFFEVAVPSRLGADFTVSVWDWDLASQPDPLGNAEISLAHLEPFRPMETRVLLDAKSGSVRLRLMFRPSYVTRTRQGTSTFASPTRIVTGVAGAPIKAVGVVGHGVGKGTSFIKRGFRSKKDDDSNSSTPSIAEVPTIQANGNDLPLVGMKGDTGSRPTTAGNGANGHSRSRSIGQASIISMQPGAGGGTATFTVLSASGFPASADIYVVIVQTSPRPKTIGKTKHHSASDGPVNFDETFKVSCTPDATFQIQVKERHKIRSDEDLGEALYFVDDSGSGEAKEVKVKDGTVVIRSSFLPAPEAPSDSPKSIRRTFLSKREPPRTRETTPNPE
ncbi:probable putative transmembrane protein [Cephalotrichum gorgonifer]|uniref:Probable putative transmembrane protein n=1 Tax=Cephalotrichum gorgonifer TaxID=2041049 RepID=A0AAE8MQT1_9PEZI|nr:probable putative transmembrane protein [Cephalotrichum gorgonifer]